MPAERGGCATVQGLVRGQGGSAGVDALTAAHLGSCAACRLRSQEYTRLARDLRALRGRPAAADPAFIESIIRRIDDERDRRFRRSWAIATVAGGLTAAAAAGVVTRAFRSRGALGALAG